MLNDLRAVVAVPPARLVLLCVALSTAGDSAAKVALLLRAHAIGASSSGLALLLVLYAAPLALLVGVAGQLADRRDLRPVLGGAAFVQLIASAWLAASHDLVSTGAGVVVLQIGFALANSAWIVALPRLVPDDRAGPLVSIHQALLGVALPVGALSGGFLAERIGDSAPFAFNAATFVPLIAAVRVVPAMSSTDGSTTARAPWLRAVLPVDGLHALRQHPLLAALTAAVLPFIVALESVNAVEVYLARDVLDATPSQFGASEAIAGAAAVCGAMAASAVRDTAARAKLIAGLLVPISIAQLGQGLAPTFITYVALAATVGLLLGTVNTLIMTLMVTATDPSTRGRILALVGGASRTCTMGALALGGILGTMLGARGTFITVAITGLLIGTAANITVRKHLHQNAATTLAPR